MTDAEAAAAYNCLQPEILEAFAGSSEAGAAQHLSWTHASTGPYISGTHGGRYVSNTVNDVGREAYLKYEDIGTAPVGSIMVKNSFVVMENGKVAVGPIFTMTKMEAGWNPDTADWRYGMVMPDGSTFGATRGKNAAGMGFCHDCHIAAEDTDYLMFLPDDLRK